MIGSDTALAAVPSARRGRIYVASRSTGRAGVQYGLWPSKGWSVPKKYLLLFVVRDLCGCLVLSAIRLGKKDNAEVCVNEKPMCSAAILRMAFG
jgi:hypothetical protein